jgi:hypothetical protein
LAAIFPYRPLGETADTLPQIGLADTQWRAVGRDNALTRITPSFLKRLIFRSFSRVADLEFARCRPPSRAERSNMYAAMDAIAAAAIPCV